MAVFTIKNTTIYAERSQKEALFHIGIDSKLGSGFVSVPAEKRELARAATAVGAAMLLRKAAKRARGVNRARKAARKRG